MLSPARARSISRFWLPTAISFFVNGAVFGGWAALVPRVTARLGVDDATFGLMLLGMGIGAVIAMVFSGWLIGRYGAGPLIRLGFVLFLASYVALSFIGELWPFVAALLLFGASGGLMDVVMNAYGSDVERHKNWQVMASFHGMWSVGALVGAAAMGALATLLSDAGQAVALSVALALLFLLCQHNLVPLTHEASAKNGRRTTIGRLDLILGIFAAICFSAEAAARDWSSLFLTREAGAGLERAGWGFAAMSGAMALCRFAGDWMRITFGERRLMLLSGAVAFAGFVLAVLAESYLPAVLGFGLVGLGLSNTVPILISAAGRTSNPGPTIAFVVSLGYAGLLASPPLLGFLAGRTSLSTMFLVVAICCVLVAASWSFLVPPENRPVETRPQD